MTGKLVNEACVISGREIMKKSILLLLITILLLLTGCSSGSGQIMDGDGMVNSYTQISQEQA